MYFVNVFNVRRVTYNYWLTNYQDSYRSFDQLTCLNKSSGGLVIFEHKTGTSHFYLAGSVFLGSKHMGYLPKAIKITP